MKIIGITGGIGSGKSEVLTYIKDTYGAVVCQTDLVAHMLQRPGAVCYQTIVKEFGTDILAEDGTIDRKRLGAIVFQNPAKLAQLNQIVHPAVKEEVRLQMSIAQQEQVNLFLIESALLREDHYEELCDELWYIYVEESVRMERLLHSRALSEEKIHQIMKAQASEEEFRRYCQIVIDNSHSFSNTIQQIQQALNGSI